MSRLIVREWSNCVAAVVLLAAVVLTGGSGASNGNEIYDLVIANGRVMDPESGLDAIRNVGIRGGKIAAISNRPAGGKPAIEAKGPGGAPRFIATPRPRRPARNYQIQAPDRPTHS